MKDRERFIHRELASDPSLANALADGYSAICEGMTPAGSRLGRYLRSFDDTLGSPGNIVSDNDEFLALSTFFGRNLKEFSDLLGAYMATREGTKESRMDRIADAVDNGDRGNGRPCDRFTAQRIMEILDKLSDRDISTLDNCCRKSSGSDLAQTMTWLCGEDNTYGMFRNLEKAWQGGASKDMRYMYLNPNARKSRVLNEWLVHFTRSDAAINIVKHGFDRGNSIGGLAYNDELGIKGRYDKYHGDYLFAFTADEAVSNTINIYGTSCIVFRGSGYRIWHQGDSEEQVIFDYHEPKGGFLVMPVYDSNEENMPTGGDRRPETRDVLVYGMRKGKPAVLYSGESTGDCIRWVVQHGDDMKSLMFHW